MKKFLFFSILSVAFISCQNAVSGDYKLHGMLNNSLLHSLLPAPHDAACDSSKATDDKHFNSFLREGFARKFGL